MVLDVDEQKRRISLGLKQCGDNPWDSFLQNHTAGTELEGEIKNITEFGLFVGLPGDIDGMVHFSDLDWSLPGEEAVKKYHKGTTVKVKVLDVDTTKERVSLGIKQLTEDPFAGALKDVKKGMVVTCTVRQIVDNGVEVTLGDGATGFIRKAELSRERSEQRPDRFAVGEKVDAKITAVDAKTRKIALSIKQREADEEKKAMADYGSAESGASLGDILGAAFSKAARERDDAAPEDTTPENVAPENVAPEDVAPEDVAPEDAASADEDEPKAAKPKAAKPKETKKKASKPKVAKEKTTKAKATKTAKAKSTAKKSKSDKGVDSDSGD